MGLAIGVDIGGTKVLAAVVDPGGRVLDTETAPTPGPVSGLEQATPAEVEAGGSAGTIASAFAEMRWSASF